MKIFSSYDDYGYEDERLYSVLMSEDELALFSEAKDSHTGRNIALASAGTAAATGAGIYGANKLGKYLEKRGGLVHAKEWIGPTEEKVGKALQKPASALKNAAERAAGSKASLRAQGYLGEASMKAQEGGYAAQKWIKAHPGKASAIAAATLAGGAGLGYGAKKLKDRKKDK